jgi:aspartate racemase
MKTVGIIGGLGPETSAKFYFNLIKRCLKQHRTKRPPVLMWSIPMELKTESNFINKNRDSKKFIFHLVNAAKRLERGGADFLVIPCNSAHSFIEQIRSSVDIPVISIVEETTNLLISKKIKEIGLLAAIPTIKNKIFSQPLEKNGIKVVLPTKEDQLLIGKIINRLVLNKHDSKDKKTLLKIAKKIKAEGVESVVLACTDLQLIIPSKSVPGVIDSLEILLEATKDRILS